MLIINGNLSVSLTVSVDASTFGARAGEGWNIEMDVYLNLRNEDCFFSSF